MARKSEPRSIRLKSLVRSVRFRLTIWYVLILAVVLFIFGSIVYASQAQSGRAELENNMRATAQHLGRTYPFNKEVQLPGAGKIKGSILGENDLLLVINGAGEIVQQVGTLSNGDTQSVLLASGVRGQTAVNRIDDTIKKLKDAATSDPSAKDALAVLLKTLSVNSSTGDLFFSVNLGKSNGAGPTKNYLFYSTPILIGIDNNAGTLILGHPREDEMQLQRLLLALLLAAPLTLIVAAAGGYWLAARAMRPVLSITRAAREIGETELHRRLNLDSRDELGELASTFDGMLDRLESSFVRQRQFTADASHELRTPLTIVDLEVSHALSSGRTPDEYRRALAVIQAENAQMSRLVGSLLTLARADARRATLKRETLDLGDLALDVAERLDGLARQKGVTLLTGDLPELTVEGDRAHLSQMLLNLVENGIKYSCGAGPDRWVRIDVGRSSSNPHSAWVRIEDNGPGIAAMHLPHIFDRFYRVDSARTHNAADMDTGIQRPQGSGLGLAISLWVAEAHGGSISVTSREGLGSVFTVSLPTIDLFARHQDWHRGQARPYKLPGSQIEADS